MTLEGNHNNPPISIGRVENKKLITVREIRGRAIIEKGIRPEILSQDMFIVPSQNSKEKYTVRKTPNFWICTCPDYKFRNVECKHIHAIKFWLMLREQMNAQPLQIASRPEFNKCAYCGSIEIVKNGKRKNDYGNKQRFKCKVCNKTFVIDSCFKRLRGNPKTIALVLDLYFKGVSLRKIKNHLKQFYGIKVSHGTIYNWIIRFTEMIKDLTTKDTKKAQRPQRRKDLIAIKTL